MHADHLDHANKGFLFTHSLLVQLVDLVHALHLVLLQLHQALDQLCILSLEPAAKQ